MASELTPQQLAECKEAFKLFDEDEDGQITTDEFENTLKTMGLYKSKDNVQEMMRALDKDGNGTIDFAEFRALMEIRGTDGKSEWELKKAFEVFTPEGKSFITVDKLKEILEKLGETLSPEEGAEMMKLGDVDKDGRINFEDFKKLMEKL